MKYKIILADPPWNYKFGQSSSRYIIHKYDTMELDEICSIPVKDLSDEDSVLFLWVTFPKLNWAMPVIEAWGFEYKTCAFVWVKTNKNFAVNQISFLPHDTIDKFTGMGYYTRSNVEICLLATKGQPLPRLRHDISQVVYEPLEKHSKKPDIVRTHIVSLFGDLPRIELFAREATEGWTALGNGIDGKDIKDSIQSLVSDDS